MNGAERQETIKFETEIINARTGIVRTHIVRVVEDRYVHSGYCGSEYIRHGVQKGYREELGIVDGFITYAEQDEWIALLLIK